MGGSNLGHFLVILKVVITVFPLVLQRTKRKRHLLPCRVIAGDGFRPVRLKTPDALR